MNAAGSFKVLSHSLLEEGRALSRSENDPLPPSRTTIISPNNSPTKSTGGAKSPKKPGSASQRLDLRFKELAFPPTVKEVEVGAPPIKVTIKEGICNLSFLDKNVTPAFFAELVGKIGRISLTHLNLRNNPSSLFDPRNDQEREGLKSLASLDVVSLNLSNCVLNRDLIAILAHMRVNRLDLSYVKGLTVEDCATISQNPHLEYVTLESGEITEEHISQFVNRTPPIKVFSSLVT